MELASKALVRSCYVSELTS